MYSRVVSNEYRVWYILALEGVNEVAEFKMAYTDPSCAADCSRFGYVRPPCPLDQELIVPEGPEPTMSSNDGLSSMFTPGGKVETDGFTEDDTTVVEIISDEEGVGVGKGVGVSRLLTTSDEDDIGELLMGSVDKGVAGMLTTSDEEGVGVGVGRVALGVVEGEGAVVLVVAGELFVEAEHGAEVAGVLEVVAGNGVGGRPGR